MDPNALNPLQVDISDPSVRVTGIDAIWHNIDATSADAFTTFRKWFQDDLDTMVARVNGHVQQGLYSQIAINASKHSIVVICASKLALKDFPDGAFEG
ncbi:hypothetical protein LTR09_010336 [Extremus antarcticus]|uniref:Uncharacterized protein n=1 Tax=Extremus antarcticus TaxID=702011 RepID=A0AAJ0D7X1_9PEZI|nr:hypothetical protein LTR09_010336 [Extremus antarcticus]